MKRLLFGVEIGDLVDADLAKTVKEFEALLPLAKSEQGDYLRALRLGEGADEAARGVSEHILESGGGREREEALPLALQVGATV